jgi:hypothetical protein
MSQDRRSSGCGRKATMLDNEYAVWYTASNPGLRPTCFGSANRSLKT